MLESGMTASGGHLRFTCGSLKGNQSWVCVFLHSWAVWWRTLSREDGLNTGENIPGEFSEGNKQHRSDLLNVFPFLINCLFIMTLPPLCRALALVMGWLPCLVPTFFTLLDRLVLVPPWFFPLCGLIPWAGSHAHPPVHSCQWHFFMLKICFARQRTQLNWISMKEL